jgi:hypothetical protein
MTELPEAPASVTYSVITNNNYPVLFTIREMTGLALIEKMGAIEKKFSDLGYKPQQPRTFGPKEQKPTEYTDYDCPICGARVIKGSTKDGKQFETCETRKYDFKTKTTTGCTYIKWL